MTNVVASSSSLVFSCSLSAGTSRGNAIERGHKLWLDPNTFRTKTDGSLSSFWESSKARILYSLSEVFFKPLDEPNINFQGNFAPVKENGSWMPARVIDGEIPHDFPDGTYIRNGPNPHSGEHNMMSLFGKTYYHWFEGDGMLHATRFENGGKTISYQNKFIETTTYLSERATGRRAYQNTLQGDALALRISFLLNQLLFGKVNKPTCNTNIIEFAGKAYVLAEADSPYEINVSNLSTIGPSDFNVEWEGPFTSHPKLDPDTNELVGLGFSPIKPHLQLGVISGDGKVRHKVDLGLERCTFAHDLPITKNYNIILDFPLTFNLNRLISGGSLLDYEKDSYSRIGVMPRYGDARSIRWFDVEVGHFFHSVNAYEDDDEVVLMALLTKHPFLPSPAGFDRIQWLFRALTPTKEADATDPWLDGALCARLHEWRFNLKQGTVSERDLTDLETSGIEMPTINGSYIRKKNKYGYAQVLDLEASKLVGMPKYGRMVKMHLPSSSKEGVKMEYHELGKNKFGSEPLFVPKPNGTTEDDGWIVSYVHDELTGASEVYIVDAKNFQEKPVARILLPQRVPYGFHSAFFPKRV